MRCHDGTDEEPRPPGVTAGQVQEKTLAPVPRCLVRFHPRLQDHWHQRGQVGASEYLQGDSGRHERARDGQDDPPLFRSCVAFLGCLKHGQCLQGDTERSAPSGPACRREDWQPLKAPRRTCLLVQWLRVRLPTGNSAPCYVAAWMRGEFGGEWIHVYV